MATKQKYIRHSVVGFLDWPVTDDLWHSQLAEAVRVRAGGSILSAGFAYFEQDGTVRCGGRSESLGIGARADDSEALRAQLGLPKPETQGAAK